MYWNSSKHRRNYGFMAWLQEKDVDFSQDDNFSSCMLPQQNVTWLSAPQIP